MQYGVNVPTYKRVENEKRKKKINIKDGYIKLILVLIIGFMLSRVGFTLVEGLYLSPFGIAYLMSVVKKSNKNIEIILPFLAVVIGYLSGYNKSGEVIIYSLVCITVIACKYISNISKKNFKMNLIFVVTMIIFALLEILLIGQSISVDIAFSLVKSFTIIPMFYILNYGTSCIQEINTNHFYSMEELISIAILICLVVAGVGNLEILGVQIRSIMALAMIITVAYSAGSSAGAILGVAMGIIIGIGNNDLLIATTLYSICGLVVGIFTETNKFIAILSYLVVSFMIISYSSELNNLVAIEIVSAALIMLMIPRKFMKEILNEIDNEEKSKIISDAQIKGIKSEFIDRLEGLKVSLCAIADSVENLSGNEKLLLKNKGTALVENLADRVCQNCEMNNKCWGRELHNTFSSFGELMLSCESKKPKLPSELNTKCVKSSTLLKSAEELFITYTVNEALKSRLMEGRQVIANQMTNMSFAVSNILKDFNQNVNSCLEIDKLLRKTLSKNKIRYKDIYSFTDRKGRLKIKIKLDSIDGESYCKKNVVPAISSFVKMPLCIAENGCIVIPESNECVITIEESPKYHVSSYVEFNVKDGEKYSGDSYSFGTNKVGEYVTIISDGMGSGPEAGLESEGAIDLIEKFMEGGFSESTMLNTVNTIMGMKFSEDEKFTTLDMNLIDLYTGDVSFIKIGGVMSFVKSGKEVEVIDKVELPFGILDTINVEPVKRKIKNGDIIVSISDGIIDVDKNNLGEYEWLVKYLENSSTNPETISKEILEKAKSISNGKALDDMTVVVSKLYSSY